MKQSLHYSIVIGFLALLTILFAYTLLGRSTQRTADTPTANPQSTRDMIGIR